MNRSERHLRLVTETIEAVNSTLDLDELFELIATKVAAALDADACFVYLYDGRADELVLRAVVGSRVEASTRRPKMRPGEGITGTAAAERAPIMIPRAAHLDPRFKRFPNLHEEQYESILAVPILAKDRLEGALNIRTVEPRGYDEAEIDLLMAIAGQVAQAIENAKLYDHAQRRVAELEALSRISEAVSESLYLEESLAAIVETTIGCSRCDRRRDRPRRRPDRLAGGARRQARRASAAPLEGPPARRARLRSRHARSRTRSGRCSPRSPTTQPSRSSTAGQSCGACSHRRSTTASRTTSRRSRRCSACRPARPDVDPRRALEDSVNRILAIAAVHEVLTERREDDVDLGELVERLRRMIVQGLGAGKEVEASVEPISLAGDRATALALVFSELLQNALEHGGDQVADRARPAQRRRAAGGRRQRRRESRTRSTAPASRSSQALVRDELKGTIRLAGDHGLRAEVVFPA